MATVNTTTASGTFIGIATGDPATFDETGFSALTYQSIGKITNAGEFGKTFELITNKYLSQRGQEKRKGTFNAGKLDLTVDIKGEAGQAACEAALESDDDFNFKITFKNGVVYYVRGQVTSFTKKIGGPDNMIAATIGIELNPFFDGDDELASVKGTA